MSKPESVECLPLLPLQCHRISERVFLFPQVECENLVFNFLHGNSGVGKGMESLVKRKNRVFFHYLNVRHFILGIPIRSTLLRRMLFIPL